MTRDYNAQAVVDGNLEIMKKKKEKMWKSVDVVNVLVYDHAYVHVVSVDSLKQWRRQIFNTQVQLNINGSSQ